MSTPAGKPSKPIEVSEYARRSAPDRAAPAGLAFAGRDEPLRSPYAPKTLPERASAEAEVLASSGSQPLPFVGGSPSVSDAPAQDRDASSATAPRIGESDQPAPHPDGGWDAATGAARPTPGECDHSGASLQPGIQASAVESELDADGSVSLQPAPCSDNSGDVAPPQRPEPSAQEYDLERLETSLRWLQRQETATRLARVAELSAASGLAPGRAAEPAGEAEKFAARCASPLSLEPERLAPPPRNSRGHLFAPLGILVASILAAAILHYVTLDGAAPPPAGPQLASFEAKAVTTAATYVPRQPPSMPKEEQPSIPVASEPPPPAADPVPTNASSESERVAMVQPQVSHVEPAPASKAARALDAAEIKLLIKQGEQFIAAGDLVTARIVLQRAAQAGDAGAATALGATYDPGVLARLGVLGIGAEPDKARDWYRTAESLGSAEATKLLQALAAR